jgi:hypothetical protein
VNFNRPLRHPKAAFGLLVAGLLLSYCWFWAPPVHQGEVWNIATSALVIYLLGMIGLAFNSAEVWVVGVTIAFFKVVVMACSTWYIFAPWEVAPGQELCSAKFNLPLGIIGLAIGAALIAYFTLRKYHG